MLEQLKHNIEIEIANQKKLNELSTIVRATRQACWKADDIGNQEKIDAAELAHRVAKENFVMYKKSLGMARIDFSGERYAELMYM